MRIPPMAMIAAAAVATLAPAAMAQTAADKADVRCILVFNFAASRDAKFREPAKQGSFFYLGRLNARGQTPKLGAIMLAEGKTITSAQMAEVEFKRCVAELTTRGNEFAAAMSQAEAASTPAKPAPRPPT
jgi:hypothetical protein